jgi:hypothetical protein
MDPLPLLRGVAVLRPLLFDIHHPLRRESP